MINEITWEFIRENRTDYNRLQELTLHNDEVFEAIQIIQRMMENMPKSKVADMLNVIENHYDIYQQTKHKTTVEKQQGLALLVAFAGAALGTEQINQYEMNKDFKKCLDDNTLMLINK